MDEWTLNEFLSLAIVSSLEVSFETKDIIPRSTDYFTDYRKEMNCTFAKSSFYLSKVWMNEH